MAALIKSLGIEGSTFALGSSAAAERIAGANGLSASLATSAPRQTSEERATEEAARQLEATIRKRVEEALDKQANSLQEKRQAEEQAAFAAAAERGYAAGMDKAAEEVADDREALAKRLALLEENIVQSVAEAFADATDLACEIAFEAVLKMLGREIASGEAVAALTREIAVRAEANEEVVLRVHPDDAELLSTRPATSIPARYRIEVDTSLTRGGCVIESSHGIVDARLETRLDAFMVALRGSPSEHPEALP